MPNLLMSAAAALLLVAQHASAAVSCSAAGVLAPNEVQGTKHASPYVGQTVTVEGVATRVTKSFLYIQVRTLRPSVACARLRASTCCRLW
jgi:hypothetical protein